jgi:hypothetical protein
MSSNNGWLSKTVQGVKSGAGNVVGGAFSAVGNGVSGAGKGAGTAVNNTTRGWADGLRRYVNPLRR